MRSPLTFLSTNTAPRRRSSAAVARLLSDISTQNQSLAAGNRIAGKALLEQALQQLQLLTQTRHRLFCISDFWPLNAAWDAGLHALARRNELVVVHVYDPLEAELPRADQYAVTDGEQRVQFNAGDPALRTRYSAEFAAHQQAMRSLCRGIGARYRSFSTGDPADRVDWWA